MNTKKSGLYAGLNHILFLAFLTYIAWVIATFLLEGRILTLLRPEAVGDRILYTVIANMLIGSIIALLVIRRAFDTKITSPDSAGFRPVTRTIPAIVIAFVIGFFLLLILRGAVPNPVILLNIYAQVFTVTIAEIAICWGVVGSIVEGTLSEKGRLLSLSGGILVSSILFGMYHVAHSPPFNQVPMMIFLTLFGIITGLVYFIGRDIYATMVFHNFFGTFGVMQSLGVSGVLSFYTEPLFPVLGIAVISISVFVAIDMLYLRKTSRSQVSL
ncbi:MAG: CPBP family intramembrane metalloprotease [Methanomicrobiales archaeon]|nr:CPBP family intramembrane metalloprotease [Methanomicrobiales archaeon]